MKKVLKREFDKDRLKKEYSKVYWFYDLWSDLTESKAAQWLINHAAIHDGMAILDVGTGTAKILKRVVKRNPNGSNVGIDLSPDMLKQAEKNLESTRGNYELIEANAYDLPFPDERFDVILVNYVLDLLPEEDYRDLLAEFARVLKPGGLLLLSTMTFGRSRITRFWDWVAKTFPGLLTGCRPVSLLPHLAKSAFKVEKHAYITQNTFPSEVIKAVK